MVLHLNDPTVADIQKRIGAAWRMLWGRGSILMNKAISVNRRLSVVHAIISSCMLWWTESWTPRLRRAKTFGDSSEIDTTQSRWCGPKRRQTLARMVAVKRTQGTREGLARLSDRLEAHALQAEVHMGRTCCQTRRQQLDQQTDFLAGVGLAGHCS